ncbi:MAG: carboxypeptidase [Betaproteobacteria bacterium]|nr:carboxypeptidase [Betaproteobacteria bacterium]
MPHFAFDRFLRYDELTERLHALARTRPDLVQVESIGKSHEGRDIWLATVTRQSTGPAHEKPAFWVDGNIHSIEVSASTAALYFLNHLVEHDGVDPQVTRALDSRAFYICPRINPDGAEWALADKPRFVRSSTRPYPRHYPDLEERIEGFDTEDIDGDGKILRIRIRDDRGHWKKHPDDPRLMVRRDPAESGGEYYRLLPEGRFTRPEHFDGTRIRVNRAEQGLDLNRNFPEQWRQEFEQLGAGDYPTSEPEVKAVVDFFIRHPNICGGTSFHTFSGVLLRPFGTHPDTDMAPEDLWVYKAIGKKGSDATGYPAISVYEEFRYHPKEVITGTWDWVYDQLGVFAWVVELWSPMREAGIEKYDYIDWFRDHPVEDDLKMMKWNDDKLGGRAYVPWRPFDHPELGPVEIGGWDTFSAISNVPLDRLEAEVAKFPAWLLWQALISPKLELRKAHAQALGGDLWKVRLEVQNTGYLPTNVSKRSAERKVVEPLQAEITLPAGAHIVSSAGNSNASFGALPRVDLGQLTGWSHKHTGVSFWPDAEPTGDLAVAEWVVRAPVGTTLQLAARHPRAGVTRTTVRLG